MITAWPGKPSPDGSVNIMRDWRSSATPGMVPTLEIGNIAGWINYAQFADRGMQPTFNMIKNTGQRLVAAQDRLKALTDVVQVSALTVQSDATRRNTDTLREIAAILSQPQLFLRRRLGPSCSLRSSLQPLSAAS